MFVYLKINSDDVPAIDASQFYKLSCRPIASNQSFYAWGFPIGDANPAFHPDGKVIGDLSRVSYVPR